MNDEYTSALQGELGRALLRAGRDEWPSNQAVSRALAAVGAGAAVVAVTTAAAGGTAASAAKSSVALLSFGSLMKWLGIGAMSGVVVAGVAHELTPPARTSLAPSSVAVAPAAPARERTNEAKREPKLETTPVPAPALEPPAPATKLPTNAREPGELTDRGVPLAAEVTLVDRARATLASGNPARALDELRTYETTFPEPRLLPEVLFLRMEAHLAAGDRARARETAERSVQLFPRSPHAARAREVILGSMGEKK